jgi:hypothetical protein
LQKTIICKGCNKEKPFNPRCNNQQYCGDKDCQNARKARWQREKMAADKEYRSRQNKCKRRWRENYPDHEYQEQYRQEHEEYVRRNREMQRIRNRKYHSIQKQQKIVKMDTLSAKADKTAIWQIQKLKMDESGKIVKMDTLFAEIKPYQGSGQSPGPKSLVL